MKKVIKVTADTNDADYVTQETEVRGEFEEKYDLILKMASAVMDNRWKELPTRRRAPNYNYITSEYARGLPPSKMYPQFSQDDWELFDELVPYGEHGVHSIVRFEVREVNTIFSLTE